MTTLEKLPGHEPYASPFRILIIIAASVFIAEACVMILLFILPPLPHIAAAPLDATLVTILIYPILYRYVVRPMTQHINERMQAEAALRRAQDELELRVQERTEELTLSNAVLYNEIDERQRTEAALRDSEERLRALSVSMSEGLANHEVVYRMERRRLHHHRCESCV
jgi:PAS domain-containing protein